MKTINDVIIFLQDFIAAQELKINTISKRGNETTVCCEINNDSMTLERFSEFMSDLLDKKSVNSKTTFTRGKVFVEITVQE